MKKPIFFMAALMLLGLSACTSFDCPLNNVVYGRYAFYGVVDEKVTAVTLTGTMLTVTAAGTDSILLNSLASPGSLSLPMSYYNAADTLVFTYTNDTGMAIDTIWVQKTNLAHYESPDCPTAMFHTITGATSTHNLIDTLIIANPNVNYEQENNIEIHLISE